MNPLLSVENLSVSFGSYKAVKGVSFDLAPGEILGIVGESGSGKSVTCRAVAGLLAKTDEAQGRVRLAGQDLLDLDDAGWRAVHGPDIGMIFQNPASHLDPLRRIGKQIAAPMIRHLRLSPAEAMRRAIRLLEDVGIPDAERRARSYPHEFSGGMKQRAMIAAAISCGPKLLIADEPTTALDVTVQARILKLLQDLNREHGLSIILISHDLGVISNICNRVVVMRDGEVVEQGAVEKVVNDPQHPYTQLLIASQPGRKSWAVAKAQASPPAPLLQVSELSVRFPPRESRFGKGKPFLALDRISFDVAQGETVGIVGESGSGKSTLARAIIRQNQTSGGTIRLAGHDVHTMSRKDLTAFRRKVQMVFQNPYDSLNPRMTIRDAVAEPIWQHRLADRHAAQSQADELLEMVELPSTLRDRRPRELSGGQCQRVGLARALALQPQLLIADEITSALDVTTQAQFLELLTRLQRERALTLLYISHDLSVVSSFCQKVHIFKAGRIVESGPASQVLSAPQAPYTQELVDSLLGLAATSATKDCLVKAESPTPHARAVPRMS